MRERERGGASRRRRQRGQALIETVLLLNLLVIVLVGFFHLAAILVAEEAVDQAARTAVQAAAVQQRLDQACAAAISYASSRLGAAGVRQGAQVTILTYPPGSGTPQPGYGRGGRIDVRITARIPVLFGAAFAYPTHAAELIRPGQARYPVRRPGSQCTITF